MNEFTRVYDFLRCAGATRTEKTDGIFVFGHIDARIALHAADLWKRGATPMAVLTGKGRKAIPGFPSEAEFYADAMQKAGVPAHALILETASMNTLENITFGMRACAAVGFAPMSLTLCALPPLLRRAQATFAKQFPDILTVCDGPDLPLSEFPSPRILRMLGEFDRFIEYAAKGDMVPVTVPEDVAQAVDVLRAKLK